MACTGAFPIFCNTQQNRETKQRHMYNKNGRDQLKCDGTRTETWFCLSAKQTSPFKLAGASVQSTTGSQGVRINTSNVPRKCEGYWLPTPFASFPFTSPPVCHHVPSHFNWSLILLPCYPKHKQFQQMCYYLQYTYQHSNWTNWHITHIHYRPTAYFLMPKRVMTSFQHAFETSSQTVPTHL